MRCEMHAKQLLTNKGHCLQPNMSKLAVTVRLKNNTWMKNKEKQKKILVNNSHSKLHTIPWWLLHESRDARILQILCTQNWPACAELSSVDQMAQSWKNFAEFLAILLPSSAITTATARENEFRVKLIKYFAEVCEWFNLLQPSSAWPMHKCLHFHYW